MIKAILDVRKLLTSAIYNFFFRLGIEIRKAPSFKISSTTKGNVTFLVGPYTLLSPYDHALPSLLAKYPDYGWSLGRLAQTLHQKYTDLLVLDVGANIGDSTAIIQNSVPQAKIVCIEGSEKFYKYLLENIRQYRTVVAFNEYMGKTEATVFTSLEENQGTIRLLPSKGKTKVHIKTLDSFLEQHSQYKTAQLLKIDADGYDLQILCGGKNYIKKTKPVIYFEYAKFCFAEFGDDGLETFFMLEKMGYITAVLYDNFGRFLLSVQLHNHHLLRQLDMYVTGGRGAFAYLDIVLFNRKDTDLAEAFITQEERYITYDNKK